MRLEFSMVFISLVLHLSHGYEMEEVTRSPESAVTVPPETIETLVLDFEGRRDATFQPTEVRISLEDAADLCQAFVSDQTVELDLRGKRGFQFIPVYPATPADEMSEFKYPCFGWIRKRCAGVPKPPFDYRCHYWVPYYVFAGPECGSSGARPVGDDASRRRKKRLAKGLDAVTVNGMEARTLCSTSGQLPQQDVFMVDAVALPTNEESQLRCINWKLSPEGGWTKDELPPVACDLLNTERPGGSILSEVNELLGVIEDMFRDIVRCEATGKVISCRFVKDNIQDSLPN